jgi:hypothetical protein
MGELSMSTSPAFSIEWSDGALAAILSRIKDADDATAPTLDPLGDIIRQAAYERRNELVWCALFLAQREGYDAGIGVDYDRVTHLYIYLPAGQVRWSLEGDKVQEEDEKYARVDQFVEQQLSALGAPKLPQDALRYGEGTYEP